MQELKEDVGVQLGLPATSVDIEEPQEPHDALLLTTLEGIGIQVAQTAG